MIPLADVQASVIGAIGRLGTVEVDRRDALGFVLAADVVAAGAVPPFANTAMDGYAVHAADTEGASDERPVRLAVVGEVRAGQSPTMTVGAGQAVRIMTGAPIPEGADAIVIVEVTRRGQQPPGEPQQAPEPRQASERGAEDQSPELVEVLQPTLPGAHIRPAGGDLEAGQVVFRAGTVLGPARVGVLASADADTVTVYRRARVGVMSTGDELVETGPLSPGQIRDSNRPMLLALLHRAGAEPVDLGRAPDDEDALTDMLERALADCDAIITSGGVSVGDYDYVSAALERIAATDPSDDTRVDWYQVAIRPSKPLCIAMLSGKPVFGLPGNPVSSRVSFELFARPSLLKMMGHADIHRPVVVGRAEHALRRRADGKLHLDRVRVQVDDDGRYFVTSAGAQESNLLAATADANGLALLPDGEGVEPGADVRVMLLDS